MSARVRTLTRCEGAHEVGAAGLPGGDHLEQCTAPATRLLRVRDEMLEQAGQEAEYTLPCCGQCATDLLDAVATGGYGAYGLYVLANEPLPEEA